MSSLETNRLKFMALLLRRAFCLSTTLTGLLGTRPYYAQFSPNRSFIISSSTSLRKIQINVYEPNEFDKGKTYPVYINLHGSGFVIPMLGTDSDFCRIVSNRTGAIVLDCDYAKAPEWPFPAASEDTKDIITHVLKNQERYFDTSRITIGGFSAGAALALTSVASKPSGTIKGIVAFYPPVNFSLGTSRPQPLGKDGPRNPLTPSMIRFFDSCYLPPGTDFSDPRLSACNIPTSLFPRHVFIVACERDPLRDEAVALANSLENGGVSVVLQEIPGEVHGWDKNAKERTPGGEARHSSYEAAVEMLNLVFKNN